MTSDYWTIARKGTEKAQAEIPNVEVDFRVDSDGTAAEQQRLVDDLLARGIEGIAISPVDPVNQTPMLNKAAAQVRDAGKIGKVKIVCFDEEDETLVGIKDGGIYATVVQQPFEFGRQSIAMMVKILDGDRSVVPATKQVLVPTLAVRKDNVEAFIKKINELRGRT